MRGLARARTGRTRKGADFYQWRVTLKEGELREGLARIRSPRLAGEDGEANAQAMGKAGSAEVAKPHHLLQAGPAGFAVAGEGKGEPK